MIWNLETLIPPPVELAQAPMNISETRTNFASAGQRSKSVVAKPVVVIAVATWNMECLKDSPKLPYIEYMEKQMIPVDMAAIAR